MRTGGRSKDCQVNAHSDEHLRFTQAIAVLEHEDDDEVFDRLANAELRLRKKAVADNLRGLIDCRWETE